MRLDQDPLCRGGDAAVIEPHTSLILLLQSLFDVLLLSVAVAVAALQTSSDGHCASMLVVGAARLLRQLELLLSTLMRLLSKALSTLVMIL